MKKLHVILSLVLIAALLTGCAGTTVVYYSDCTCPTAGDGQTTIQQPTTPTTTNPEREGEDLMLGLAIHTANWPSSGAGNHYMEAKSIVAAVLVDGDGVIRDCTMLEYHDVIHNYNAMGESYLIDEAPYFEETEELQSIAAAAVGKTVADLATIGDSAYYGSYAQKVAGGLLEKAVSNAKYLGAKVGDELRLAAVGSFEGSDIENDKVQLNVDMVAITMDGDVITACYLDALQAAIVFYEDTYSDYPTKNELGEAYGMKAWAGAKYEWNEQAANFAAYVIGKTAAEVSGIAVNEATKPTDVDLAASVTIAIGGFQALIAKAAK